MRHPTGRRLMEMLRNPQPRKPLHRGKGRRAGRRRQKKKNRASVTKRFAFGPISFPNNGSASQFRATPIPIGSKRGDNYWPSWEKVERSDALPRVLSAPFHFSTTPSFHPVDSLMSTGGTVDSPSGDSSSGETSPSPGASRTVSRPDSQNTRYLCPPLPVSPAGRDARASGSEGTGMGRGRGLR